MLQKITQSNRFWPFLILGLFSVVCFSLTVLRVYMSNHWYYLFLNWNLFLAFIPFFISSIVIVFDIKNKIWIFISMFFWLIFFPNAPYILTDFLHLYHHQQVPIWYDLLLLSSFSITALIYGLFSLADIEQLLQKIVNQKTAILIVILLLFLSGFGVYLGRFLRWNSWDIFLNPGNLFMDIAERFVHPLTHKRTWGMTLIFGLLLNTMYFSLRYFPRFNNKI